MKAFLLLSLVMLASCTPIKNVVDSYFCKLTLEPCPGEEVENTSE